METVEQKVGEIPTQALTLEHIPGMEAAKRALEVALAGEHGIVFVFNSNSPAAGLVRAGRRIAEKHGLAFHGLAYPTCKCGNYASTTSECRCKPISMKSHLTRLARRRAEFDIWMDACCVKPAGMQVLPRETEEVMADRIMVARKTGDIAGEPDIESRELLTAYRKHVGKAIDEERILRVARTIACLEGSGTTLRSHHVAEAIQYQPMSLWWIWEWTGLEQLEIATERK